MRFFFAFLTLASLAAAPPALAAEKVDLSGLTVTRGDGTRTPMAEMLPDGPAILHFWATWCGPCRKELPDVADFAAFLGERDEGSRLFAVSVDRADHARVAAFMHDELGLERLTTWQVAEGAPGTDFRLFGYPATIVLRPDGTILKRIAGPARWDDPAFRQEMLRDLDLQR